MPTPTISVATPNYNHGMYLPDMIESCLSQDYEDWELVIVDDASTDNSIEVVSHYASRHPNISLLVNEQNQGAIKSVNRALRAARGKFVVMRSADDINLPNYFSTAAALLEQYPQAAFFCGDIAYFREDAKIGKTESLQIGSTTGFYSPSQLKEKLGITPIHGHTVVIRRELFESQGYFNNEHGWYNDWLPFMTSAFEHGVCYAPKPFVGCRLLADSFCGRNASQAERQNKVVAQILTDLLQKHKNLVETFIDSGTLGFFGKSLWSAIGTAPFLHETLMPRSAEIKDSINDSMQKPNGIRLVITRTLEEQRSIIDSHASNGREIWIYGAGLHTEILIDALAALGLPPPSGILLTATDNIEVLGLPTKQIDSQEIKPDTLIMISSKSYDEEMIKLCKQHQPLAKLLSFW